MENILLLYSRYSAYVHASFMKFATAFNYKVHVVRFQADANAPFTFAEHKDIRFYNRNEYDYNKLIALIEEHQISIVLSTGWVDKDYLKVCRYVKGKGGLTIGLLDNQWMGTMKQQLLTKVANRVVRSAYKKLWVPGIYQFEYARRLGYERYDILLNYYSADTDLFLNNDEVTQVPKRFIYVGRLLEIKGIEVLYNALKIVAAELESRGWTFMVIGNGDYADQFRALNDQYRSVEYISFLQQKELAEKTREGGVFVLPSNYDAWSVAVHEFACQGFPLLLSEAVGSRATFLKPGYNGELFITGSPEDLAKKIRMFSMLSNEELTRMGNRSKIFARTIDLEIWAYTLNHAINEHLEGIQYQPLKRTKYQ